MTDQPPPQRSDGPQWGPIPERHQSGYVPPKRKRRWPWIVVGVFAVIFIAGAIGNMVSPPKPTVAAVPAIVTPSTIAPTTPPSTTAAATMTTAPTTTVVVAPAPVVPAAVYPPTTLDQFKAFARSGNPTAIHPYKSEAVGAVGICPQPRIEATADANLPVRVLQADEAAFFLQRGYLDQNCGGVLFLYDSPTTSHDEGFNVGRVLYDVGSSDPAHRLEVDTSDITPAGSFTLTY